MVTTGLIVRLDAKPGKEEDLNWFAVRVNASSFAIVDVFPDEAGRESHLDEPVASALIERATELLARAPEIERVDVLAAKLSATRGR